MAKINEEVLVIKISTLLPDQADMTAVMDQDNIADNRTLVEIETIKD
jgi:hypothetical protein